MNAPIEPVWCAETGPHTWHASATVTVGPVMSRSDTEVSLRLVGHADDPSVWVELAVDDHAARYDTTIPDEPVEVLLLARQAELVGAEMLRLTAAATS